ncbi:MAG: four helix bundle protein [Candidatus Cloacimonetes bacterium]|nr:four helix bundle protein [Candidatus Cloacimonadota bacterium]MDD3142723.1 four helix bundle protein [Candidatus Cloacimonadota bacterium]MDY0367022.1 four helix bundle protein [Candidatus Syntrophosphaera sp.]HOY85142.1 four helix bundle protein [Candidatus Syntrophosphaera sp.]HPH61567.1 four helix bundle protein [Candidatus Syntrophosphaera sp.]
MGSYRDLDLYNKSMDFVVRVYKATESFPKHELFGICSQLRRCAVSIPSNIAEGSGRNNRKEFIQFLFIANGSLSELETQLEIASRLGYIENIGSYTEDVKYIRKMLTGLIKYHQNNDPKAVKDNK